jgi:hypothetical protein
VAVGFGQVSGWLIGTIFELGKQLTPMATMLLAKRARSLAALLAIAWLALLGYSAFASCSTVTLVIDQIERKGAWRTQARAGTAANLADTERQLAALAEPKAPRPAKVVREILSGRAGQSWTPVQIVCEASVLKLGEQRAGTDHRRQQRIDERGEGNAQHHRLRREAYWKDVAVR